MTQFEAALRLHREGRLDEAAEAYNSILVVDPSNFDAAYHFSVLRAGQGRFDEALALVEFAGGARPGSWQAQAHKGALLLVLRRFEEGLDELRQAFA